MSRHFKITADEDGKVTKIGSGEDCWAGEFTKDELQIIHLDMTIYAEKTKLLKESPSHKALRDEVEAMIDNYCEHAWVYDESRGRKVCSKCGLSVWHE